MSFFFTSLFEKYEWSCFDIISILIVHGRAILALGGEQRPANAYEHFILKWRK